MLKYGNKEFRNLQEQVEENARDVDYILHEKQALNQYGLRVVEEFPDMDKFREWEEAGKHEHEYGDAVIIGEKEPFEMYVWTRASITVLEDHWFDLGQFPLPGPVGPRGDRGPEGPQGQAGESTRWYAARRDPGTQPSTDPTQPGTMWLNTETGHVWYLSNSGAWHDTMSIIGPKGDKGENGEPGAQGPQGEPGPKGDTGDVGGFINIRGILVSTELLPSPVELNDPTAAYLVGDNKDLYIQVGETKETRQWYNAGMLNVGTYVEVDGSFQNVWSPDYLATKDEVNNKESEIYAEIGRIESEIPSLEGLASEQFVLDQDTATLEQAKAYTDSHTASVEIDEKTIIRDSQGKLMTAVGGWEEQEEAVINFIVDLPSYSTGYLNVYKTINRNTVVTDAEGKTWRMGNRAGKNYTSLLMDEDPTGYYINFTDVLPDAEEIPAGRRTVTSSLNASSMSGKLPLTTQGQVGGTIHPIDAKFIPEIDADKVIVKNSASVQTNLERIDGELERIEAEIPTDAASEQFVVNKIAEAGVNKQDKLDSWSDSASVSDGKLTINYKVRQEDGSLEDVPVEFEGGGGGSDLSSIINIGNEDGGAIINTNSSAKITQGKNNTVLGHALSVSTNGIMCSSTATGSLAYGCAGLPGYESSYKGKNAIRAAGNGSTAVGFSAIDGSSDGTICAQGHASYARGSYPQGTGYASTVRTYAKGQCSTAIGIGVMATTAYSTVIGKYSELTNNDAVFVVANGTAHDKRHNAFAVNFDGTIKLGDTSLSETQLQELLAGDTTEQWTFTLADGSTVTKNVVVK